MTFKFGLLGFATLSVGIGDRKTKVSGERRDLLIIYRSTQPTLYRAFLLLNPRYLGRCKRGFL